MERKSISRSDISNELANSNPELFKSALIESLKTETKFGFQVWDTLCKRNETDSKKIAIDSKTGQAIAIWKLVVFVLAQSKCQKILMKN